MPGFSLFRTMTGLLCRGRSPIRSGMTGMVLSRMKGVALSGMKGVALSGMKGMALSEIPKSHRDCQEVTGNTKKQSELPKSHRD